MLSQWFQRELPSILASCLVESIDEAAFEDYDPSDFWAAAMVLCMDCGTVWPCIWTDIPGNEFLLDCPECGAIHSSPLLNE